MDAEFTYQDNQMMKYNDHEAVREKWFRIYRNINPYTDPVTMLQSVREAFTLAECVMDSLLQAFYNENVKLGIPVEGQKDTYVFYYSDRTATVDFADHSIYGMINNLCAIGYQIPEGMQETRSLQDFIFHNMQTVTTDYFQKNLSYDAILQSMNYIGQTLVALDRLNPEDVNPSFDCLRVREGDKVGLSHDYAVNRFIAQSGTSRIYEGCHTRLNQKVAIKELIPHQYSEELLHNESGMLVRLRHPQIPKVYDIFNQNGTFYIIMDYIDGVGLDTYIQERRCDLHEKMRIADEICNVMIYLHTTVNMIHEDLKPQNIMVDKDGKIYIIDFGTSINRHNVTESQNVRGVSVGYTAPEVLMGGKLDARADIYSIGAILDTILYKDPHGVQEEERAQLERIRPVVERCMQYNPSARYQDVSKLRSELRQIIQPVIDETGNGTILVSNHTAQNGANRAMPNFAPAPAQAYMVQPGAVGVVPPPVQSYAMQPGMQQWAPQNTQQWAPQNPQQWALQNTNSFVSQPVATYESQPVVPAGNRPKIKIWTKEELESCRTISPLDRAMPWVYILFFSVLAAAFGTMLLGVFSNGTFANILDAITTNKTMVIVWLVLQLVFIGVYLYAPIVSIPLTCGFVFALSVDVFRAFLPAWLLMTGVLIFICTKMQWYLYKFSAFWDAIIWMMLTITSIFMVLIAFDTFETENYDAYFVVTRYILPVVVPFIIGFKMRSYRRSGAVQNLAFRQFAGFFLRPKRQGTAYDKYVGLVRKILFPVMLACFIIPLFPYRVVIVNTTAALLAGTLEFTVNAVAGIIMAVFEFIVTIYLFIIILGGLLFPSRRVYYWDDYYYY